MAHHVASRWLPTRRFTVSEYEHMAEAGILREDERSEPQPDLALLVPRSDYYTSGHPVPADILLLVEVADSTLAFDREIKIPLYARTGVREVWLVDLTAGTVVVFRDPAADGYQTVQTLRRGASLAGWQPSYQP